MLDGKYKYFLTLRFCSVGKCSITLWVMFSEWRKNPTCSAECCLAMIQPMAELGGTFTGMSSTNIRRQQPISWGEGSTNIQSALGGHCNFAVTKDYSTSNNSTFEESNKTLQFRRKYKYVICNAGKRSFVGSCMFC